MDFGILGRLEVLHEGRSIALGGTRQRALLALLLVHAGETVTTDRVLEELWPEHPPDGAAATVQVHVSRLRKALAAAGDAGVVTTVDHGYALRVAPEQVDAHRFERLVTAARQELADGRAQAAAPMLEEALALWRGPPLADLADEPFAQREAARLEDVRVGALEQLVDAKLALGLHAEVVPRLEALIAEHPYRERLRAQLMLALYRCDRQADALEAYREGRARLVDELGIEPGARLRELEAAILAQDPALAAPEAAAGALPSGVLTFLLTDIEGSTGLWEADSVAMAAALELHDALVARTAEAHAGRTLKTKGEGDSTFTVFRRASDAVAAAVALQDALATTEWPGGLTLRVRAALHTGEAQERDGDFFGPAVNRAARLRAVAAGGTTVVSRATAELVRDRLPQGARLVDLGRHELRGLARPEDVFELRPATPRGDDELRKTVSVVFASATDAAASTDPEAGRRAIADRLAAMRAALERHGGAVEAFPGDVLMAVFGMPLLHEDDALRAVRAAAELREQDDPPRIGVGTGEVLAAPGRPLTSGAAVTAAKRLEEAAAPGEALLDAATHRLLRRFVDAEPAGPPGAVRLVEVHPGATGRVDRRDSPLVGRDRHLTALRTVVATSVAERACHLVTVLGAAGVGKSRLVEELMAGLGGEVTQLRGRCLPYGEGITYWPLTEVLQDVPGDTPRDAVAGVGEALGAGGTSEEIARAVRRLFEAVAGPRALVVVLDDLHWAEPTFLDLVEHVVSLSRDAPIVVLCMARPELLDARPDWGGGRLNATSLLLEPLSAEDSMALVGNLVETASLPGDAPSRIADASEGNPLFAEELLAMMLEEGATDLGELPVPPTIHALLAARLERLPDDERALLARVSVEGTVFHRDAARALAPPTLAATVDRTLTALARRDLVRPDRSSVGDDEAFRFRHMLIRDAAYRSLPKATRVVLHERFADWLEEAAGPRLHELEEIVGYHLEQACRFLGEIEPGGAGADPELLAARAAERLESAGRRALGRSDREAAVGLLERAARLVAGADRRARLLPVLGAALIEVGRLADADAVLGDAAGAAASAGDDVAAAHVLVQRQFLNLQRAEEGAGTAAAEAVVEQVMPVFAAGQDERGLCAALRLRAWRHWIEGRADAAAAAWNAAAVHAGRAGAEHERIEILGWVASSLFFGATPAEDGVRRCEEIREEVGGNLAAVADVLQPLAGLHAMQGRFDEARELLARSDAAFAELGLTLNTAVSHHAAIVELLAGDAEAAEAILRRGHATLEQMGDTALLSTTAAFLGQALLAQGREDEADRCAELSAELTAADDLITQVLWRGVRARTLAARDRHEEAEALAREAVVIADRTDFLNDRAGARADLASVLQQAGRADDARVAAADALELYEAKGNAVRAGRARAHLAALVQR